MLLFIFRRSPGFHFSRDDLSALLFLDFLRAIIFYPPRIFYPFSHPLSSTLQRHLARCNPRPISRYPLTCRRFFTRDTFHPSAPSFFSFACARACSFLTVRRTLKSHKALRRIFHAAISASPAMKGGIRHGGRSGQRNGEISF